MRAVVLVGGEGTRLRPLTATMPKQLLPVAEVPMIERVLAHLHSHDVTDAVLSMGYRPDAFLSAFPDDHCAGVGLTYAVEAEPLDTAGAIRFAAIHAGIDEPFLVHNGDVLTDLDVTSLVAFHRARRGLATISLAAVDDPSAFGVVPTDLAGRVTAFIEKPPRHDAPTNLINAGTYVLDPAVLDRIPEGRRVSIERETFPSLVGEGALFAVEWEGSWIDAGIPSKYLEANLGLLGLPGPPAAGAVEREPGIWTLGAAVIDGEVRPPSLVGNAAFVSGGAVVEASVVGAGARVHDHAVVRSSVLLPGAVVRAGAVVEDSIVGDGAVVGEGAKVYEGTVIGGRTEVAAGQRLVGARVPAESPEA